MTTNRPLRVFLCHSSNDKPAVRELYQKLRAEPWIQPWLDEENLLPGQDFDFEIYKATRDADAIIICLSKVSVAKEGYVNKEIRHALDIAQEKVQGAIYVIPLRLDDCTPSFEQLKKLHWVDYFAPSAHERLIKSLRARADSLKIQAVENAISAQNEVLQSEDADLYRFIQIPDSAPAPHSFCVSKYPITNSQYERFLSSYDFVNPLYWTGFPKYDENCQSLGDWGSAGFEWLQVELRKSKSKVLIPHLWDDKNFGSSKPNNPVVGISYYEASAYCKWLFHNWETLLECESNSILKPKEVRLPLETEWVTAAGGYEPKGRYPWDETGIATVSMREILYRTNVEESIVEHTSSVTTYPLGKTPYGVMDMAGNVSEFQLNFYNKRHLNIALRSGSWNDAAKYSRVVNRYSSPPGYGWYYDIGFRVVCIL